MTKLCQRHTELPPLPGDVTNPFAAFQVQFSTLIWADNAAKPPQHLVCAICEKPETAKRSGKVVPLSVDHNHQTGKPRGLLCAACNRAIGLMQEDPQRLEAAARYLRQHQASSHSHSHANQVAA